MADLIIHWFRQDLRLQDNPALYQAQQQAQKTGCALLPIYILDQENAKHNAQGRASRVWLHHSLGALNQSLNHNLCCYQGSAQSIIMALIHRLPIKYVYWNRCYEPWRIQRDRLLKQQLTQQGITVHSDNGSLLWEPWQTLKADQTPYKVFTPFYRKACLQQAAMPRKPLPAPNLTLLNTDPKAKSIDQLKLLPSHHWAKDMIKHWSVGEQAALDTASLFIKEKLKHYKKARDMPGEHSVSKLSPYLHFGEISPNVVWYRIMNQHQDDNSEKFLSELAWREFSYSLLYHCPSMTLENLNEKFNNFPWKDHKKNNKKLLKYWQQGQTGYPLVDAGMRELWRTGYMHNRVRMVVASFLVKNLLIHWRHGERYFWDCLVDADLANNCASWQWVAGCGADASPYFRIFNPITQGEKFDPDGCYTKRFVPELKHLPKKYLFTPWQAPDEVLKRAGVVLGQDYPYPIVDVKQSRQRALAAFAKMKQAQTIPGQSTLKSIQG